MRPSFTTVAVDNVIKIKKGDSEALKDTENAIFFTPTYCICEIYDVRYKLKIYLNKIHAYNPGKAWMFFGLLIGNATKIDADIKCCIEFVNTSVHIEKTYERLMGWGDLLCTTSDFFDPAKKFFIADEMVVKIKGTMKINLPSDKIIYPFSAKWKIKESDLKALRTSTYCFLQSEKFNISSDSETKYFIRLFPIGNSAEHRGNQARI